jgi:hypothetical protein
MPYRLPFVLAALAAVLGVLAGCAAPNVEASGSVAADGRFFFQAPKYAGQDRGSGVSLVAEPQLQTKSEDGEHTLTLRPFYRLDPTDEKRSHADVRQASYRLSLEHFEAGAGAGIFTWGVLESYRPTDVMNQTDFVEAVDFTAKLGQPYAEIGWIGESTAFRLYYLPYFRERTFQGVRGRPRFPSAIDTDNPIFATKNRQWEPSAAGRFTWNAGDLDLGVGVFTGLGREPTFVAELTTGQIAPRYDRIHQASVDAQYTLGAFTFKAEAFARLWSERLRAFGGGGAGVDYTFFKIVGEADLSFAAEYLMDTRPADAPITFFDHDAFGGVRLAINDTASTELTAGAIVDVLDGTTFGRALVSRRIGEHWRVSLGGSLFLGPSGKLEGSFRRDDYVQGKIAYFF